MTGSGFYFHYPTYEAFWNGERAGWIVVASDVADTDLGADGHYRVFRFMPWRKKYQSLVNPNFGELIGTVQKMVEQVNR